MRKKPSASTTSRPGPCAPASASSTPDRPTLLAPRVVLHYSPATLLGGRVSSLVIEGADLHLQKDQDGIRLKGLKAAERKQGSWGQNFHPPFLPEEIVFRDCAIIIHQEGNTSRPLMVDARLHLRAAANDSRDPERSPDGEQLEVSLEAASPDISAIRDLLPATAGMRLTGGLTLKGGMHLQPHSLQIADADLTAVFPALFLQAKGGQFGGGGGEASLNLHLQGRDKAWRFSLSGLRLLAPLQSAIDIAGDFSLAADSFAGKASLKTDLSAAPMLLTAKGARQGQETGLDLLVQGQDLRIRHGEFSLDSGAYRLNGAFVSKDGGTTGLLSGEVAAVDLPAYEIHLEKGSFSLPLPPADPKQKARSGSLEFPTMSYKGKHLVSIKAELLPAAKGLAAAATARSPLAPDLQIPLLRRPC